MVGVINDIDDRVNESADGSASIDFKTRFRKVKEHEREQFSNFKNSAGYFILFNCFNFRGVNMSAVLCLVRIPLNQETQCSTNAVFNKMEEISFTMLASNMRHGLTVLEKKIKVS